MTPGIVAGEPKVGECASVGELAIVGDAAIVGDCGYPGVGESPIPDSEATLPFASPKSTIFT